jgi:hypothetical protein
MSRDERRADGQAYRLCLALGGKAWLKVAEAERVTTQLESRMRQVIRFTMKPALRSKRFRYRPAVANADYQKTDGLESYIRSQRETRT